MSWLTFEFLMYFSAFKKVEWLMDSKLGSVGNAKISQMDAKRHDISAATCRSHFSLDLFLQLGRGHNHGPFALLQLLEDPLPTCDYYFPFNRL